MRGCSRLPVRDVRLHVPPSGQYCYSCDVLPACWRLGLGVPHRRFDGGVTWNWSELDLCQACFDALGHAFFRVSCPRCEGKEG